MALNIDQGRTGQRRYSTTVSNARSRVVVWDEGNQYATWVFAWQGYLSRTINQDKKVDLFMQQRPRSLKIICSVLITASQTVCSDANMGEYRHGHMILYYNQQDTLCVKECVCLSGHYYCNGSSCTHASEKSNTLNNLIEIARLVWWSCILSLKCQLVAW